VEARCGKMTMVENQFAFVAARTHLRAATLVSLLFLGTVSCEAPTEHLSGGAGHLEIVGSLASAEACPVDTAGSSDEPHALGELRFESLSSGRAPALLAKTPSPSQIARYTLESGLYAINWVPKIAPGEDTPGQILRVSDPAVINVVPGQVTRLEVERSTSDCDVLSLREDETEVWAAARP
jgi:hypothetical protein